MKLIPAFWCLRATALMVWMQFVKRHPAQKGLLILWCMTGDDAALLARLPPGGDPERKPVHHISKHMLAL